MDIFQRLAAAQRAEAVTDLVHVGGDGLRLCPRIRAERPADRFADEEVATVEIVLDARVQQAHVRLSLAVDLTDDGGAPLPEARVPAPCNHHRAHRLQLPTK